jgi:hypothetical protein
MNNMLYIYYIYYIYYLYYIYYTKFLNRRSYDRNRRSGDTFFLFLVDLRFAADERLAMLTYADVC